MPPIYRKKYIIKQIIDGLTNEVIAKKVSLTPGRIWFYREQYQNTYVRDTLTSIKENKLRFSPLERISCKWLTESSLVVVEHTDCLGNKTARLSPLGEKLLSYLISLPNLVDRKP